MANSKIAGLPASDCKFSRSSVTFRDNGTVSHPVLCATCSMLTAPTVLRSIPRLFLDPVRNCRHIEDVKEIWRFFLQPLPFGRSMFQDVFCLLHELSSLRTTQAWLMVNYLWVGDVNVVCRGPSCFIVWWASVLKPIICESSGESKWKDKIILNQVVWR